MNTRRFVVFSGLLLLFLAPFLRAGDLVDIAADRLGKTPVFAFGGIGFAGTTSAGEIDFRTVLDAPNAEAEFTRLLKTGNPQAQCYALVGLRRKNRAVYGEQVKSFKGVKKEVQTCGGCIMAKLPMASVVAGIERGDYDPKDSDKKSRSKE